MHGAAKSAEFGFNLDLWQHYPTNFESDFFPGTPYPSSTNDTFFYKITGRRFRVEFPQYMRSTRGRYSRN